MANRHLLHMNKLDEFATWAALRGYVRENTKGTYEVLRLRNGSNAPLIFYNRDRTDHATMQDNSEQLLRKWLRTRRFAPDSPSGAEGAS